jgi:hypothetical protein
VDGRLTFEKLWALLDAQHVTRYTQENREGILEIIRKVLPKKEGHDLSVPLWLIVNESGLGAAVRLDAAVRLLEEKLREKQKEERKKKRDKKALENEKPIERGDVIDRVVWHLQASVGNREHEPGLADSELVQHLLRFGDPQAKLEKLLRPKGQGNAKVSPTLVSEIAQSLCALLVDIRPEHAPQLVAHDLLHEPFHGPRAVARFRSFLAGEDVVPAVPHSRPFSAEEHHVFFPGTVGRKDLIVSLETWITEDDPGAKMLYNVHSSTTWTGLYALAQHLGEKCWAAGGKDLHVCWIPARTDGLRPAEPNYSDIVSHLHTSVCSARQTSEHAGDRDSTAAKIMDIRMQLASAPALLIFVCRGEARLGCDEMIRVIRDDHVVSSLIPGLLEAPTGVDLRVWRRNRILLLTNEDIKESRGSKVYRSLLRYRHLRAFATESDSLGQAPPQAIVEILEGQGYRHLDVLLDWRKKPGLFREETAEHVFRVLDALIEFERDHSGDPRGGSGAEEGSLDRLLAALQSRYDQLDASSQSAFRAVAEEFLARVGAHRPLWGLCLGVIAATPGGLQARMLVQLLLRAAECTTKSVRDMVLQACEQALSPKDRAARLRREIERMIGKLAPILSFGKSEELSGDTLDARPPVASQGAAGVDANDPRAIDVIPPELRDLIIDRLYLEHDYPLPAQVVHLLLCDASLRQHTFDLKNLRGSTHRPVRLYRRLVQTLFHGLQSIVLNDSHDDLAVPDVEASALMVPSEPRALWRELVFLYYRETLERPGEWRMSRRFARDQLKLEMLASFMRPWRLARFAHKTPPESLTMFDFLEHEDAREKTRDFILVSERQALLALNLSNDGVPELESVSPDTRSRLRKYDVHGLILVGAFDRATRACRAMINGAVTGSAGEDRFDLAAADVMQYVEERAGAIRALISPVNFDSSRNEVAALANDRLPALARLGPDDGRLLVDGLNSWAEVIATEADLVYGAAREGASRATGDLNARLARAFAAYELAEVFRRKLFERFPLENKHGLSGHAQRGAVRAALLLERQARRSCTDPSIYSKRERPGLFGAYAARMKDELIRHLGHFVRERASISIIEAMMSRLSKNYDDDDGGLYGALAHLQRAEALMLSLSTTDRVRLRFLLERSKVMRELAVVCSRRDGKAAGPHMAACEHDLDALENLALELGLGLWLAIVELQRERCRWARARVASKA